MRGNPLDPGAACGVLACWLAADGSRVRAGQRLARVRAVGEPGGAGAGEDGDPPWWVSALATGTLWHQAREGDVLTAGSMVALIE